MIVSFPAPFNNQRLLHRTPSHAVCFWRAEECPLRRGCIHDAREPQAHGMPTCHINLSDTAFSTQCYSRHNVQSVRRAWRHGGRAGEAPVYHTVHDATCVRERATGYLGLVECLCFKCDSYYSTEPTSAHAPPTTRRASADRVGALVPRPACHWYVLALSMTQQARFTIIIAYGVVVLNPPSPSHRLVP